VYERPGTPNPTAATGLKDALDASNMCRRGVPSEPNVVIEEKGSRSLTEGAILREIGVTEYMMLSHETRSKGSIINRHFPHPGVKTVADLRS